MRILLDLFQTFAKIGMFTFGGGYAMISLISNDCVDRKHWITLDEMMDITVIAESTPGPIAINCATFTGYKKAGFPGALAATIGIVLPPFGVIFLISYFFHDFFAWTALAYALQGIKMAVGILILDAGWMMVKKGARNQRARGILLCSFLAMLSSRILGLQLSSVHLMLAAGSLSLLFSVVQGLTEKGERRKG